MGFKALRNKFLQYAKRSFPIIYGQHLYGFLDQINEDTGMNQVEKDLGITEEDIVNFQLKQLNLKGGETDE